MASNKRDLKAYARFDGSGRIVAGSLILRRNKPKVGKWKEVPAYECCNYVPTTTTTTSSTSSTTTTTTTSEPIVCNEYLNDTGDTIVGVSYTLCDGTIIEDSSFADGESICIQVGTLSGVGVEITDLGPCGV